jgi:hypothetical protein
MHPGVWFPSSSFQQTLRLMGMDRMQSGTFGRVAVAAAAWGQAQGIYRFDPEFAGELLHTTDDDMPGEVLVRLPEWAPWIEAPIDGVTGFWVYLDDTEEGLELQVLFLHDWTPSPPAKSAWSTASLRLGGKISERVAEAVTLSPLAPGYEEFRAACRMAVACATYLCSEEPDVQGTPSKLNARRIKLGKLPLHPTTWTVGARFGAAFRKARAERAASSGAGHGSSPRPHVRRAHWHTFWRGTGEKRERFVKWLPPIFVSVDRGDIVPTIRPVSGEVARG